MGSHFWPELGCGRRDSIYVNHFRMTPRPIGKVLLLAAVIVLGTPFVVHYLLYFNHAASYSGICGPHAPDIPAHPCTREVYLDEFGAGFAGVGLLILELLAMFVSFVLSAIGVLLYRYIGIPRSPHR